MSAAFSCVVDASVGIKLFVAEPLSEEAHALFARLGSQPPARFYVPDLFYIECANILWKYVQRFGLEAETAPSHLTQLGQLALINVPTSVVLKEAFDLALTYRITAYDACYVALARLMKTTLVTADEALTRTLEGKEPVYLLQDIVLSP